MFLERKGSLSAPTIHVEKGVGKKISINVITNAYSVDIEYRSNLLLHILFYQLLLVNLVDYFDF